MRIGVWISNDMNPHQGGGFSYTNALLGLIDKFDFDESLDIVFLTAQTADLPYKKNVVRLISDHSGLSLFKTMLHSLSKLFFLKKINRKLNSEKRAKKNKHIIERLNSHKIDVIFYPEQTTLAVPGFPFITSNWDVGHMSMYAFPEVANNDALKRREFWYNITIKKALAVFCESEAGKEELVDYLRLNPHRIKVVPMFPGNIVNISVDPGDQKKMLQNLELESQNYFFYPAQFWAHKNHFNLVEAFEMLHSRYPNVKLVLTGSDKGNKEYILNLIDKKDLTSSVLCTGFVSNEELYTLYKNATALVMPTFLGPTNMPLLEAVALDCPALCSDFKGHREQLGDGAAYFDPADSKEMFKVMETLMNTEFRLGLIEKARLHSRSSKFTQQQAVMELDKAFIEVSKYRNCWE